jgi:uncharacterized protein
MDTMQETPQWRETMESALRREEGWLSLAGLFWLAPGTNGIGAAPHSRIRLPAGTAPDHAGIIALTGKEAVFHPAPGVATLVNGEPVGSVVLQPDVSGAPTRVRVGDVTFALLRRGERWGVRVWNRNHPARSEFPGRRWYPIQQAYVLSAVYVRYDPPRPTSITNVLGDIEESAYPGHIEFRLGGSGARLLVNEADSDGLFIAFADPTNGGTTYTAGRFLRTLPVEGSRMLLDFNRAYNPPCAFTPYATCPQPPAENRLSIPVEAGEQFDPEWGHVWPKA